MKEKGHQPVMLEEVCEYLHIKTPVKTEKKPRIIDATLGAGGHTSALINLGAFVLGIDQDERMLEIAKSNLKQTCLALNSNVERCLKIVRGNFRDIVKIAHTYDFFNVDGVLYDLGVSSFHFDNDYRGFSFKNEENPLDMRLGGADVGIKASDLLNSLRKDQLVELFNVVLDGGAARRLAEKIVRAREEKPFEKVGDLLKIIENNKKSKIHPATNVFLALRMAVNSEIDSLSASLSDVLGLLKPGGRIVVISFHSGEDKVVKHFLRLWEESGFGNVLTKKPITPSTREFAENARARSAKMRVFEKK